MSASGSSTSSPSRARRILVALAAPLLVLTLVESAARVTAPAEKGAIRAPGSRMSESASSRGLDLLMDAATQDPHPKVLWKNRANLATTLDVAPSRPGQLARWTLRFDDAGHRVRGDGQQARRRDGASGRPYRVLCLGDSVTLGFNVDEEETYPAVLEQLLAERHPDHRFEIINAGVAGWTWVQGAAGLLHRELGELATQPDLVIASFGMADRGEQVTITDSERLWLRERHRPPAPPSWLASRSAAWRRFLGWVAPSVRLEDPVGKSPGCVVQEATGDACRRVSVPEIGATVRRIAGVTAGIGADLLLLNLDFSASQAVEAVHEAAIREDLPFVDRVAQVRRDRLELDMRRSRTLGLAMPRVPLVPLGRIGLPPPEGRGPRLRLRVTNVPEAAKLRVQGRGPAGSGFRFDEELRDDGSAGDEKAGDGVFSAIVETVPDVSRIEYRYFADGVAEFAAPEGVVSSNSDRSVRFNRDGDSPVEVFGERLWMSDDVHPDAEGQRLLALDILDALTEVPSFRRATGSANQASTAEGSASEDSETTGNDESTEKRP